MTTVELLARVLVFDAGLVPTVDGLVFDDDDDDAAVLKLSSFRVTVERRGPSGWSICFGRALCLARDTGEWEYETIPSEITDEFKSRMRFSTYQEAFDFLEGWKPQARVAALKLPGHQRWKDREKLRTENAGAVKH